MNPDDVLRRGSGTLCENLLMAQAYKNNVVFPNKNNKEIDKFYNGSLIESETYVGGFVQCINNGIYRADIETDFKLSVQGYLDLVEQVPQILEFYLKIEKGVEKSEFENFEKIVEEIRNQIFSLIDKIDPQSGSLTTQPLIYHIDVASMYPNIILTN